MKTKVLLAALLLAASAPAFALPYPRLLGSTGVSTQGLFIKPYYERDHLVEGYLDWIDLETRDYYIGISMWITHVGQTFTLTEDSSNWENIKRVATDGQNSLIRASEYGGGEVFEQDFYSTVPNTAYPDFFGHELTMIQSVVLQLSFTEYEVEYEFGVLLERDYTALIQTHFYGYPKPAPDLSGSSVTVPDAGNTAAMFGFGIAGVVLVQRKLREWRSVVRLPRRKSRGINLGSIKSLAPG